MLKKIIFGGVMCSLLVSCNQNRKQEENLQQLLDRQAEIENVKEESINELYHIKDSLALQKESLIAERDSQNLKIRKMEENQQMLVDQLREEEARDVSSREKELSEKIKTYEDSIYLLKKEITELGKRLDSLDVSLTLYDSQEQRTGTMLESGIAEIDRRMAQREARKEQEIKNLSLLNRRISVAQKKTDAFQLEKQMYQDELDELLRNNAGDSKTSPYREKLRELDSIISGEKSHIERLENERNQTQAFISETDALMEELTSQIHEEYDKKNIIESFIISEKTRLTKEFEQLQQTRKDLLSEQESIHENLAETRIQIEGIKQEKELIRNKRMSDILREQAEIEQSEVQLASEEISLLEDFSIPLFSDAFTVEDTSSEELLSLLKLGEQLDSMQAMIQAEKSEIAKTRKELSEKRAEAANRRAQWGKTAGSAAIILIMAGGGILALFYYLGRRSRSLKRKR